MANPTATRPLYARRRRDMVAFLQRQRKTTEQNKAETNQFITVDGDTFKTSNNENFVVK